MAKKPAKKKTSKKRPNMVCNTITANQLFVGDEKGKFSADIMISGGVPIISLSHVATLADISIGIARKNNGWVRIQNEKDRLGLGMCLMDDGRRCFFVNGEIFHVFSAGIGINRDSEIENRPHVAQTSVREFSGANAGLWSSGASC